MFHLDSGGGTRMECRLRFIGTIIEIFRFCNMQKKKIYINLFAQFLYFIDKISLIVFNSHLILLAYLITLTKKIDFNFR